MTTIKIKIDNQEYEASPDETILDVCRRENIFIPTLCYHEDLLPSEGVCRLCLVKTNQHRGMVTSCQTKVAQNLEVFTQEEDILEAQKTNLKLLWADHAGKCINCLRNGNCELQNLAKKLKADVQDLIPNVKNFKKEEQLKLLKNSLKNRVVDDKNPCISRDSQYCVDCRRCIRVCKNIQTIESYAMNYRGIRAKVGTPAEIPLDCIFCGQCSSFCPTAAITEKDDTKKLEKALADKTKLKIVQFAPSVRFTIAEGFGAEPGTFAEGKLVAALRKLGADLVFDTTFAADLTIIEEATELVERIKEKLSGKNPKSKELLPMFTSCCPSWVLYVEKYWPQFIPNLSSCKSPQQMLGALIKTYFAKEKKKKPEDIISISVMPCTSKKYERQREEMGRDGIKDVDIVVTTRELIRLIKKKKIDFLDLEDETPDPTLGIYTGAGIIFGSSGGVMEAALRTAYETVMQEPLPKLDFESIRGEAGIKQAEVVIPKGKLGENEVKLKVGVAHEIKNAKKILEDLEKGQCDFDFVEIMSCPGGCLSGGGQPNPSNPGVRDKRRKAIYNRDKGLPIRKSHENEAVKKIYEKFLKNPGGHISHELLHTKYTDRKNDFK